MQKSLVIAFILIFFGTKLGAESFGNNAVTIPKVGAAFFDNPLSLNTKPWGLSHQWTFSTSYMHALDYRWWWLVDTGFAIGSLSKNQQSHLSAFMGGTGIRFNILQHDFRPHLGLLVHYVQFFGEATRFLPLDLGWPIFVGLKLYGGLEYFFGSEMSALVEGAYGNYININEPFRHIYFASASLALYF